LVRVYDNPTLLFQLSGSRLTKGRCEHRRRDFPIRGVYFAARHPEGRVVVLSRNAKHLAMTFLQNTHGKGHLVVENVEVVPLLTKLNSTLGALSRHLARLP
jgi:hypothetical protein